MRKKSKVTEENENKKTHDNQINDNDNNNNDYTTSKKLYSSLVGGSSKIDHAQWKKIPLEGSMFEKDENGQLVDNNRLGSFHNHNKRSNNNYRSHNKNNRYNNNYSRYDNRSGRRYANNDRYNDVYYEESPEEKQYRADCAVQQIEYYFSVENLCRDTFLRQHLDLEGYVPLAWICQFQRVSQLGAEWELILDGIKTSEVLDFEEANETIRLRHGWEAWLFPNNEGGMGLPKWIKTGESDEQTYSQDSPEVVESGTAENGEEPKKKKKKKKKKSKTQKALEAAEKLAAEQQNQQQDGVSITEDGETSKTESAKSNEEQQVPSLEGTAEGDQAEAPKKKKKKKKKSKTQKALEAAEKLAAENAVKDNENTEMSTTELEVTGEKDKEESVNADINTEHTSAEVQTANENTDVAVEDVKNM